MLSFIVLLSFSRRIWGLLGSKQLLVVTGVAAHLAFQPPGSLRDGILEPLV